MLILTFFINVSFDVAYSSTMLLAYCFFISYFIVFRVLLYIVFICWILFNCCADLLVFFPLFLWNICDFWISNSSFMRIIRAVFHLHSLKHCSRVNEVNGSYTDVTFTDDNVNMSHAKKINVQSEEAQSHFFLKHVIQKHHSVRKSHP